MIKVIDLTWLSRQTKEVELVVSDGMYDCIVFAQPCGVKSEWCQASLFRFSQVINLHEEKSKKRSLTLLRLLILFKRQIVWMLI